MWVNFNFVQSKELPNVFLLISHITNYNQWVVWTCLLFFPITTEQACVRTRCVTLSLGHGSGKLLLQKRCIRNKMISGHISSEP